MGADTRQVETIFYAALPMDSATGRAAYLEGACGGNADLRARVEALLRAHDTAGDFLKETATPFAADSPVPEEAPGTDIDRYRLLQLIGEGGFGSVYLAEQQRPVRRRVALKIIKLGMDTKQVIARFEAERQALAVMDHHNIAKVLDAGATGTGRPYFVMELVKGIPITEYCDKNGLSTKERLDLFMPVCHALQHAHQKGIIHRDIKPSNVMVALHNGKPVPKVIDFGIAKATHQRLTEKTVFTEFRQFIGTPQYMSPEQAEMSGLDIDTRSDIYSLGVLLYELLTGTTPFDSKKLRQAAYSEIQRIIREEEPPKPSTRLSRLGDASIAVARNHHSDPRSLRRELHGDLDWITMKCLQKDRTRRYAGAADLGADILRHLGHEPVIAGPPGAAYRLGKFVRRNRGLVASVAVVFVVLAAGAVVSTWFAIQATRAKQEAEHQAAIAQEVIDLLKNSLASADPASAQGREVTVGEMLTKASETIEGKFEDEPLVEASVRMTLGEVHHSLGDYEQAELHLQRALAVRRAELGEEHHDTLTTMNDLAVLNGEQGRYDEAELLLNRTLELRRRLLGEEDPYTLNSMNSLALLYRRQARYDEAEPLYTRTLELRRRLLGEENPYTLISMNNLAVLYKKQGRYDQAELLYARVLELRRRVLGDEHPDTMTSMNNLAALYKSQGRYEEAEPLYVQALSVSRRVLGEEHRDTLRLMNNLAVLYRTQDRYDEAETLCVRALDLHRRVFGEQHPGTLSFTNNLASLYQHQGRSAEAEPLYARVLALRRQLLGDEHQDTLTSMNNLAYLYKRQGRYEKAEPLYKQGLELGRRVFGEENRNTLMLMNNLAALYRSLGRYDEAEPLYERGLEVSRRVFGGEHPNTLSAMHSLAVLYSDQRRYDEAEPLFVRVLEARRRALGKIHRDTLNTMNQLALLCSKQARYDEAEPLFNAVVAGARSSLPAGHWHMGMYLGNYGRLMTRLERYAEAERALLESYNILEPARGSTSEVTKGVIQSLEDLYETWGKPDQAANWRAKLTASQSATSLSGGL